MAGGLMMFALKEALCGSFRTQGIMYVMFLAAQPGEVRGRISVKTTAGATAALIFAKLRLHATAPVPPKKMCGYDAAIAT